MTASQGVRPHTMTSGRSPWPDRARSGNHCYSHLQCRYADIARHRAGLFDFLSEFRGESIEARYERAARIMRIDDLAANNQAHRSIRTGTLSSKFQRIPACMGATRDRHDRHRAARE